MVAVASLLQSNPLKWKQSFSPQLLTLRGTMIARVSSKFRCSISNRKHLNSSNLNSVLSFRGHKQISTNPFEVIGEAIMKALNALKKPVIAVVLLGLLLMFDPNSALAASGGAMGGDLFDTFSQSSSSSGSYSSDSSYYMTESGDVPNFAPSPLTTRVKIVLISMVLFVIVLHVLWCVLPSSDTNAQKTSVLKLQVALLGTARTLQRDLNQIAKVADTSTSDGLKYVLTDVKSCIEDGEKRFKKLSIEERSKFDEVTLVDVNHTKSESTTNKKASGFKNECIVVTILVAAEGVHKLPAISGSENLKEALQKLSSIPKGRIMAVEVLWTPQNENDKLSMQQVLEDYPLLKPL